MSDEFDDLIGANFISDDDEKIAIAKEFAVLDMRQAKGDPYMEWRSQVNMALADEGINISWELDEEHGYAWVQPLIKDDHIMDFEKVPIMHLRELYEEEDGAANPKAVAAYLKSILYDKRFRLFRYEE